MKIKLLQPYQFGTGDYKPGDIVDVAHTFAGDMVRSGQAAYPEKAIDTPAPIKQDQQKEKRSK